MNFADIDKLLGTERIPMAVCMPEEEDSIIAAYEASNRGFVECILVGNANVIHSYIEKYAPGFNPEIIHADTPEMAAFKCVELVRNGRASAVMKGNISTPILLKAVLNSETGIKKSNVLCHVLVYEWDNSLKFLTDGGMIPHPTLEEKIEIVSNTVALAHKLGLDVVRVAALSSVEKINPKIKSTLDAAILSKMGERGQFGKNCLVEGPLALDNAISEESAHHKGIYNEVVGKADVLLAPDIDTGNILGKSILYYGNTPTGGMIIGAKVPVIMLSRSDTIDVRLNSIKIALAAGK
ncbi:MAG: Phosphate acetyltransferase [bacterium ADurb.Bin157]|nr:MAG: Phosphate acetyltransferase [bacterium ADurb.Bin157]